jgi:hypothetical protein
MSREDSITSCVNDFELVSQLSYKKNESNIGKIILNCDNDRCRFYLSIWFNDTIIKIFYCAFTSTNTFMLYKNNVYKKVSFDNMKYHILSEINNIDTIFFINTPKKLFIDYVNAWFNPNLINNVFI